MHKNKITPSAKEIIRETNGFLGILRMIYYLLGKGGYVFGSVGLSVCLFVYEQHYSKSYEQIGTKFYGGTLGSTMKN